MTLEQQVTSLEISKLIKELGVKQESLFYWVIDELKTFGVSSYSELTEIILGEKCRCSGGSILELPEYKKEKLKPVYQIKSFENGHPIDGFAAFTASELGEMLPMEPKPETYFETIRLSGQHWTLTYKKGRNHPLAFVMGDNEADARGKMLIYLLENKLILHYDHL